MSEKALRARWREELIDLQSMIEPAKNEEIARRAINIAWACLEKAENQAMMLRIYQDKTLQHVESVGEKKGRVEVVRCMDCKHYDGEQLCVKTVMMILPKEAEWYFCGYGDRKEEE